MSYWELFLIGFEGLLVHKVRSMLSILGIIFGVASVVAVLAVVGGARKEVLKKMEALGTNNIIIKRQDFDEKIEKQKEIRRLTNGLALSDIQFLKSIGHIDIIAPFIKSRTNILIKDFASQVDVFGITPDYMETVNFNLKSGRYLSDLDNLNFNKVCVIEENIITESGNKVLIGDFITIDQEFFMIVGILKSKDLKDEGSEIKDIQSINKRIYIPLNSSSRYISRSMLDPEIDGIILKVDDVNFLKEVATKADVILTKVHNLDPTEKEKDYEVNIAVDLVQNFESTQNIFNWVLGCSAGISLLVGGIGIMNIMLANVTERRKEVGIRLSIGAKQTDILYQFVFESAGLGIVGGFLGLLLGIILTYLIKMQSGLPTDFSLIGASIAIFISVFDAILFGTYPAWKASKLDPVEALHED
jgi:putative ABC transport system permease protein